MPERDLRQEASTANWEAATDTANRLHLLLRQVHEGGGLARQVETERFLTAAAAQQQALALATLFDQQLGLAGFAQMRSLIETSLRLGWMLDPDVDAAVRVARTLTIALAQRREVDGLLGGDEASELSEAIEECGGLVSRNKLDQAISVDGIRHPTPGDLVAYGSSILPTGKNGRSLGELYGVLSSAAHGGAAIARYLLTRPASRTEIHVNAWDIWEATQSTLAVFEIVARRAERLPHNPSPSSAG